MQLTDMWVIEDEDDQSVWRHPTRAEVIEALGGVEVRWCQTHDNPITDGVPDICSVFDGFDPDIEDCVEVVRFLIDPKDGAT